MQATPVATRRGVGPLPGHQLPMPAQYRVWRYDGGDLSKDTASECVPQLGKAAAPVVIEPQAATREPRPMLAELEGR